MKQLYYFKSTKMKKLLFRTAILSMLLSVIMTSNIEAQEFRIRGRLHMDSFFGLSDAEEFSNGFNNRRARLGAGGTINDKWDGRIELDFADESLSANDFRLRGKFGESGRLWIGQFKVPQGLNQLTSSNEITFIERSSISNIIAPARRMGVAFEQGFGDAGFKTMVFGRALGERGIFQTDEDGYHNNMPLGIALRGFYGAPVGEGVFHVGASVVYEDFNDNNGLRLRDRPEARDSRGGAVRLIDVSLPNAENTTKFGLELLFISGAFSIEGEYMQMGVSNVDMDDASFSGYHVQTSYVLTGESRSYSSGAVGGIRPANESGAWEIAARYSVMDLNDDIYLGGKQSTITFALNHYVTNRLRFMANVIYVDIDRGDYDKSPLLGVLRAQYNF